MTILACPLPGGDCPNFGRCCDMAPDDAAAWCDDCRRDYEAWLDRLAAEAEAHRLLEDGLIGWSLDELMIPSAN